MTWGLDKYFWDEAQPFEADLFEIYHLQYLL